MGRFEPKRQGGGVGGETSIEYYHGELGNNDDSRRKRYHA